MSAICGLDGEVKECIRCGSSGGGGTAREVEPDYCRLAVVDFLGAMEVDIWGKSAKNTKRTREEAERAAKWRVEG